MKLLIHTPDTTLGELSDAMAAIKPGDTIIVNWHGTPTAWHVDASDELTCSVMGIYLRTAGDNELKVIGTRHYLNYDLADRRQPVLEPTTY